MHVDLDDPTPFHGAVQTNGGDSEKLRGIPAIGRGVAGAIPKTNPLQETIRRMTQSERMRERMGEAA